MRVQGRMFYRIYLRHFHGRDGYLEVGLNDSQIVADYESYLRGEQFSVRSYSLKENGGTLTVDFHEVLAIRSVRHAI
jgi:hypothetical protein